MASAPPRPPALTLTCVFLGVGSLLLLLELTTLLGSWGSIELQDAVRDTLATPELSPLGIGLDTGLEILRWFFFGMVALAASALVFAVYTARGHLVSRVALTVICGGAALVFALGLGLAGILPALFASVCASSLWSPEARRWFDAVNGRAVSHAQGRPNPHAPDPHAPGPQAPAAVPHAGSPVHPTTATSAPGPVAPTLERRPRAVTASVVVTTVGAGLATLAALALLLTTAITADVYRTAAADSPFGDLMPTYDEFQAQFALIRWFAAGALVLSGLAVAAAVALLNGKRTGAVALAGLSGLTVAYSLFATLLGVPTMAAAIFVILQLRRPEVRDWLESQRRGVTDPRQEPSPPA